MNKKIFAALGLTDLKSYLLKYFLPIFLFDFLFLFIFLFAFENSIVKWVGVFLFFAVLVFLFGYPMILIDNQTRNIEENIHYFITYAGALSTVNLERKDMFANLAEKTRYLEISKVFKKLLYLVENIRIDFSTAAYKLAALLNSESFARFLERMGIALSFNSNISKFFLEEQKAMMDSYTVIYQEGLERIKLIQEMFVSLILAFAFVLATVLLIPFMTGIDTTVFLAFGILGIFILDISMMIFTKYFIPKDKLYHDFGWEEGRMRVLYVFLFSLGLSFIIVPFVIHADLPIMLKVAFIVTPLLFAGYYSNYEEKLVWKRDALFPPFIRSLGEIHKAKGGTLTTTVETLLPHNFGILNPLIERVFKRLKITNDKFNSWWFFSKESGSALISEFMDIFVSVVYRGGSAEIAGKIVSDNMNKINGLRDMKREFASTMKGNVYGTYFGLAITIYISLLISVLLYKIFNELTSGISGMAKELMGSIFATGFKNNFDVATYYVAGILIIHAALSSLLIKEVDGGNKFSALSDFVIMIWMGALLEIGITTLFKGMFATYFGG